MKKKLNIGKPLSNCYQFGAYPLAILSNYNNSLSWIYSNYIHTCFDMDFEKSPVPFYYYLYDHTSSPWLHTQKIRTTFLRGLNIDIIDFVEKSILSNNYIVLNINEFYIPNRFSFGKKNFTHDIMIYGFDSDEKILNVYGFDNTRMLNETTISYKQFLDGFNSHKPSVKDEIILYELDLNGKYEFNLKRLWENLKWYLNSSNVSKQFSSLREPWVRAYGIKHYDCLIDYYKCDNQMRLLKDIKVIHFFYEHKLMMLRRFEFIKEHYELKGVEDAIHSWSRIVSVSHICRNLHLKGLASENIEKYSPKIITYLSELKKQEITIISKLIEENTTD